MGEQSAKGLRGAKMEDVVFGGTAKRSQVGFAQVALVIDNTEQIFPTMEETEVSVTRRYYRSGESEYYINHRSVRLRDVAELFMDTGMGREGYSIIGQGKIDEILSARSGERREIFEEAAGISKFRHRKEEAERKLERTQENLVRINDKIAELELQVDPLRDQAERAKRYLVLRDELRLLEISTWLEELDALRSGAQKLKTDLAAAAAQRDQARDALEALYGENERFGERMREKDVEAEALRAEAARTDARMQEQEAAVAVLESTIAHQEENIRRAQEELTETDSRNQSLEQQAAEQEARIAAIDEELRSLEAELDALLERAREASRQAGDAQARAEALRGQEAIFLAAAADSPGGERRPGSGDGPAPGAAGRRGGGPGRGAGAACCRRGPSPRQPPRPGGRPGQRGGRRQHHCRPCPADGGAEKAGGGRWGGPGQADTGCRRAG